MKSAQYGSSLADHVRDQRFHHGLQVARGERVRGLVGQLDRGAGDAGLGRDLLLDQRQAVGDDVRLGVGGKQDLLQGGSHGALFSLVNGVCPGRPRARPGRPAPPRAEPR